MSTPEPNPMPAPSPAEWSPAAAPYAAAPPYVAPPPYQPRPAVPPRVFLQTGVAIVAIGVLAASVVVAFASLLDVVRIWFQPHWVPVARAVLGIVVGGLALYVLRLLTAGRLFKA